jgi:SulP family sulfate permease
MPPLPLASLRGYRREWLRYDVVGGLSAGAVVIPQAMAYATIAGMPVEIGLYTCMVPMLVYALLGGSRTISVSTTSTIATLSASTMLAAGIASGSDEAQRDLMTLTLLVGVILALARLARLGAVVENISHATLTGIKAGVGLTVACSQLPKILGVAPDTDDTGFFRVLWSALRQVGDAEPATVLLSVASIGVLLVMGRALPQVPAALVVVALGIGLVVLADLDQHGVALIAPVPSGIPLPALPRLDHVGGLLPGALAIAVMAFLETVSVARGVRRPEEPQIVSDQELLAVAVASLAAAPFHALPPAGGFSQTAVNLRAGARTQLSEVVTVILAVAVALFLAPVLSNLPQATLGALVVVATLGLLDLPEFRRLARINRVEFWVALLTALVGLTLGLLPAVAAGVVLTLYLVLRELDQAHVAQLVRDEGIAGWRDLPEDQATVAADPLVLRLMAPLYTANVRTTLDAVLRRVDELDPRPGAVVVDVQGAGPLSVTVLDAARDFDHELAGRGTALHIAGAQTRTLLVARRVSWWQGLEEQGRVHPTLDAAVAAVSPGGRR